MIKYFYLNHTWDPTRYYHTGSEWTGTPHSPKLQDWSLTISWLSVISRTLVVVGGGGEEEGSYCREVDSVFYSPSLLGFQLKGNNKTGKTKATIFSNLVYNSTKVFLFFCDCLSFTHCYVISFFFMYPA